MSVSLSALCLSNAVALTLMLVQDVIRSTSQITLLLKQPLDTLALITIEIVTVRAHLAAEVLALASCFI